MIRALTTLAALTSLAGCTSGAGTGPSLLPRAIEEQTFDVPAAAPAPAATPDAALDKAIADLTVRRQQASIAFAQADQRAASALARGGKAVVGSDAWLDAQTALAALDEERATLLAVLTDLEQLAIGRAVEGAPSYPALDATRVDTEVELDRIAVIVARRKAALPL